MDTAKEDFYLLSELCGDDTVIVTLLIQLCKLEPSKPIAEALQVSKVSKYEREITMIVDTLNPNTLKDLCKLLKPVAIEYRNKNISKQIPKGLNLIDFVDTLEVL